MKGMKNMKKTAKRPEYFSIHGKEKQWFFGFPFIPFMLFMVC